MSHLRFLWTVMILSIISVGCAQPLDSLRHAESSQNVRFGLKAGLNVSTLTGDTGSVGGGTLVQRKSKLGFHGGVIVEFLLAENFSVQPELLISTQGGVIEQRPKDFNNRSRIDQTLRLTYINLPIMLKINIKDLSLEFGPQIGYVVGAKTDLEYFDPVNSSNNEKVTFDALTDGIFQFGGDLYRYEGNVQRFEVGASFGVSYHFYKGLFAQLRFNYGFTKVEKELPQNSQDIDLNNGNAVFQVSLGYRFN